MKTHNIMKKILSLVLVAILTINIATPSTSVEASQKGNTVTKTVDGIKYRIEKTVKNGVNHVKVYKGNSQNYCELYLSKDKKQLVRKEYDYNGKTIRGKKSYDVNTKKIDLDISIKAYSAVMAQGISWNKKTYEHWKYDYWYKKGNNGSKVYFQIGCVAKYQIRVDNNKKNKKILEKYASKIKSCNKNYALAKAAEAGTGIGVGFVVALVIANAAFPPSVIVDVVVALLGGGTVTALVNYTVKSYCDYEDIKDIYVDARACGKKIK